MGKEGEIQFFSQVEYITGWIELFGVMPQPLPLWAIADKLASFQGKLKQLLLEFIFLYASQNYTTINSHAGH